MSGNFTTAEDIILRGNELCRLSQKDIRRIVTLNTSGSSGAPKRLYFSDSDIEHTVEFFAEGMKFMCGEGDTVLICMGNALPDGIGALLSEGLERIGAKPYLFGGISDYAAAADCCRKRRPHTIVGIPSQLRRLALTAPDIRPANVLLSADYIAESVVETLTRVWSTKVFTHYGLTESGLGFAVQCPALEGQHIRHDEFAVEIIDPNTGENLPDGEWGELVFTTLRREAMPLYRYRTGDISRLISAPCKCGHDKPRLGRVLGRISELNKPIPIYVLDELLFADDGILDFTASLDCKVLSVEAVGDIKKAEELLKKALPQYDIKVSAGGGFFTHGTKKRALKIIEQKAF
jgi:phenylacetate-coenzyme A ligase PaaK-like adenylate-forming protein